MSANRSSVTRSKVGRKPAVAPDHGFRWGRLNSLLMGLGVAVLAAGYLLLSKGDITLAPALLVFGYVVLIPAALLVRWGAQETGE